MNRAETVAEELIEASVLDAEALPTPQSVKDSHLRSWIVPAIIGSALLMQLLEATVIANALPAMAKALRQDPLRMNAAITYFLLASAVFLPASGWVADKFGARRVFMASMVLFAISSAACGFAQNMPQLLVGRVFQGLSCALMSPVGRLVLLRTTPKSELIGAMSVLTMPALLGPMLGPVLGGAIVTFFNWRWIFFINLPIALAGVLLIRAFVPEVKPQPVSPLDWWGIVLSGAGLAALIFAFESVSHSMVSVPIIAGLFVFAAVSLGLYLGHAKGNPHAIMDLSVFREQTFTVATIGGSLLRTAMGALPFLLAMLLQVGFGLSAFAAGLMTFMGGAGSLVMKSTAPWILRRVGFRPVLLANGVIVAATFMAAALFTARTPHGLILVVLATAGFFRSLQFSSLNALTYADIDPPRMSAASTVSSVGQQLSQSVGIAIAAGVLQAAMKVNGDSRLLARDVSPAFIVIGVLILISFIWYLPLPRSVGDEMSGRT